MLCYFFKLKVLSAISLVLCNSEHFWLGPNGLWLQPASPLQVLEKARRTRREHIFRNKTIVLRDLMEASNQKTLLGSQSRTPMMVEKPGFIYLFNKKL